jgi:hypothetical protein
MGWAGEERKSLSQRGPADTVLALALVHHLAIGNNVPFSYIAHFLQRIANWLIIEFVPKEDPQVARLLQVRRDIFSDYHQAGFESAFEKAFELASKQGIRETARTLYLFKNKNPEV